MLAGGSDITYRGWLKDNTKPIEYPADDSDVFIDNCGHYIMKYYHVSSEKKTKPNVITACINIPWSKEENVMEGLQQQEMGKLSSTVYEYRAHSSFYDISADQLLTTNTDLEYRKNWDSYVVDLKVVDTVVDTVADTDPSTESELVHSFTSFTRSPVSTLAGNWRLHMFTTKYTATKETFKTFELLYHDKNVRIFPFPKSSEFNGSTENSGSAGFT